MSIARSLVVLSTASLMFACEAGRPSLEPTSLPHAAPTSASADIAPQPSAKSTQPVPDLSGTWTWSEEVILVLPPEAAPFFGFDPEGPRTHLKCRDGGTMDLVQTGSAFTGTATQTAACETRGGQVVVPPVFPSILSITEGRIEGRSVHFLFCNSEIPCPYVGTISVDAKGLAVEMEGTGRAIPPGHPLSPLFVDPPSPPTKTVTWQASRP